MRGTLSCLHLQLKIVLNDGLLDASLASYSFSFGLIACKILIHKSQSHIHIFSPIV